jgi:hypothetical protein
MLTQSLNLIACYIACFKRSHADLLTSGKHCGGQENRELLETVDSEESADSLKNNENFDHYILLQPERVSTV